MNAIKIIKILAIALLSAQVTPAYGMLTAACRAATRAARPSLLQTAAAATTQGRDIAALAEDVRRTTGMQRRGPIVMTPAANAATQTDKIEEDNFWTEVGPYTMLLAFTDNGFIKGILAGVVAAKSLPYAVNFVKKTFKGKA